MCHLSKEVWCICGGCLILNNSFISTLNDEFTSIIFLRYYFQSWVLFCKSEWEVFISLSVFYVYIPFTERVRHCGRPCQQGLTSLLLLFSGPKMFPSANEQEMGPRLIIRDTFFHINNAYIRQEKLGYVQGCRAHDSRDGQPETWGMRKKLSMNIGD